MVVWITGLSGAGKTTISKKVYHDIKKRYKNSILLDGDILRGVLDDCDYTLDARLKGAVQLHNLCKMLEDQEIIVVCATMSLFNEIYKKNRDTFKKYIEVYVKVDMDILIKRDQKQLYSKALKGIEKNVVGIDLSYDEPKEANIVIDNSSMEKLDLNIKNILDFVHKELI